MFTWQQSGAFNTMRLPFRFMLCVIQCGASAGLPAVHHLVPGRAGLHVRGGFGTYLRWGSKLLMFYRAAQS